MSRTNAAPINRVLSFDGGPVSLINVRLLAYMARYLEEQHGRDLLSEVDLFAGVSCGAFAAIFLASRAGSGASSYETLMECSEMLDAFMLTTRASCVGEARFLSGLGPLDTTAGTAPVLESYLGSKTLGELRTNVMAASFDLENWRPKLFTTFAPLWERDAGRSLVDVALASSSYPMLVNTHYLPPTPAESHLPGTEGQFVDGAVMINNPTMTAVCLALEHPEHGPQEDGEWCELQRMRVFSLGATVLPTTHATFSDDSYAELVPLALGGPGPGHDLHWGWLEWMVLHRNLFLNLTLQAPTGQVDEQCRRLLGPRRYQRLAPQVNEIFAATVALFSDPDRIIQEARTAAEHMTAPPHPDVTRLVAWLLTSWR
jgi:hypothetical protein